jgi:hypothetical protein
MKIMEGGRVIKDVSSEETTEYMLKAVSEEKQEQAITKVQILSVALKEFCINEEGDLVWDVLCSNNVKINGKSVTAAGKMPMEGIQEDRMILTAEGKDLKIISVLYNSLKNKNNVTHFQKTFTCYQEFQILDVSWKTKDLNNLQIIFQDLERGNLYKIRPWEKTPSQGTWQDMLTGTDPKRKGI